ncbi:polysaccharide pyruvyl transferase family protein [Methylopila musalis]|uniref:Polysaccharide pyruvyl transferase family protein n=1 Tax=Methylopila musalis TaxID=1134781 RepID=A0ABW3ZB64_9HYPH
MTAVKLYWWGVPAGGTVNVGDEIGRYISEFVSRKKVEWANLAECNLLSAGSTISWLHRSQHLSKRTEKCFVWGTGLMSGQEVKQNEKIEFCSVRGYLTKTMIETTNNLGVGDPGILISELWPYQGGKKHKLGIIPHWKQLENPFIRAFAEKIGGKIIDVTSPDIKGTIHEIASCERIVSSSLHGVIFADSYGVPNIWMKTKAIHGGRSWKFYDYFTSAGRSNFEQVDVLRASKIDDDLYSVPDEKLIGALKKNVFDAFPRPLLG